MRAVVQRTTSSSVWVEGQCISEIKEGLTVLLGVSRGDTEADALYLADKITQLRIFSDTAGKMNRSILDESGELLVISQFTLLADCRKGRRPSFDQSAPPQEAVALYDFFVSACRERGLTVKTGKFQAEMLIRLENHGPVTILLDSSRLF
ncbi:D-aminoacyl-tRNA deacylase [Azotosporobacter soli]|uniref:D-aminoacyl-tRNA deacylase n=1 Tax=Azotosporobacter soli TaxID=3055040 RepID=UPI0031FEB04D